MTGINVKTLSPTGTVTSRYGDVDAIRNNVPHKGVDFACSEGSPIHSLTDGIVSKATDPSTSTLGNGLFIKTEQGYQFIYGHASKLLKHVGDKVDKGDVVALCGNSGRSTGSHLHFSSLDPSGHYIDPQVALSRLNSILEALLN